MNKIELNRVKLNEMAKELATLNLKVNELFNKVTDALLDTHLYCNGKDMGKVTKVELTKNPQSVQDFCKEHRCWAIKDKQGSWYPSIEKPKFLDVCSDWTSFSWADNLINKDMVFPNVPWDKSLVAPDGRLILIEGKKEKKPKEAKFKAGKWYKAKNNGVIYQCIAVDKAVGNMTLASVRYENGQLYPAILDKNNYYEMKHYNPDKKKKEKTGSHLIKRGEPIFVWNVIDPQEIPAIVRYFHSYSYCGVFTYINDKYGEKGTHYTSFRKYDPKLVGVPRCSWPKEE